MQTDLLSELEPEAGKQKMPLFINILTILTIIGSSLYILSYAVTPMFYDTQKRMIEYRETANKFKPESEEQQKKIVVIKSDIEHFEHNKIAILTSQIGGFLLCIIGAVKMRRLKLSGYYIYIGGKIICVVFGLILFKETLKSPFNIFLFSLMCVYIILYTFNRKHLTR